MRSISQLNIITAPVGFTCGKWVQVIIFGYEVYVGDDMFVVILVNDTNNFDVPIHKINLYLNKEGFTNGETKTLVTGEPTI
jgi:hypothetical protein